MKQRNGFVSNSSSSSFIIITTEANWNRAKENLHPYQVAVAEALKEGPFDGLGQKLVKFATWSNHGGSWSEYIEVDYQGEYPESKWSDEAGPDHYEAFEAVCAELQQGDCVDHDQNVG